MNNADSVFEGLPHHQVCQKSQHTYYKEGQMTFFDISDLHCLIFYRFLTDRDQETERLTQRKRDRRMDRQMDRRTDGQMDKCMDRQTERQTQTDRKTDRETELSYSFQLALYQEEGMNGVGLGID